MKKGFTLIELMVVIAIIAALTALATVNFNQARVRARDVQRKSELRQIRDALELYKGDRIPQWFPVDLNDLVTGGYLSQLPIDPREKSVDGSWVDYSYTWSPGGLAYSLSACLENASDPDASVDVCGSNSSGRKYYVTQL